MALVQRLIKSNKDQYIIPESLTHSLGTISATINGVGYNCTLSGLSANTLYFLYMRPGSSNLQFVTTVPSVYRVTYPEAILVGAFYSNGAQAVAFGAFCTIDGVPTTGIVDNGPLISGTDILAVTTAPTFSTTISNSLKWWRIGTLFYGEWDLNMNAAGTAGSGDYRIKLPANLSWSSSVTPFSGAFGAAQAKNGQQAMIQGMGHASNGTNRGPMIPMAYDSTTFRCILMTDFASYQIFGTSALPFSTAQALKLSLVGVPVNNWTNTPLKDL